MATHRIDCSAQDLEVAANWEGMSRVPTSQSSHDSTALARIDRENLAIIVVVHPALGHLEQVAGGEEPGVGHEPLVHRTQLVDAQLRIGDVAGRVALLLAGRQHQLGQHLLKRLVAQLHLVEVAGGAGVEEQGIQPGELEVELVGGLVVGLVEGVVAVT